jgi:SAM-dependent methyltransferase
VQAQYEANPYPRWVELQAAAPIDEDLDILIAGCGTGRVALSMAKGRPNSRVLAVDLSRTSLAYAMRAARMLGVDNIAFAQADLLQLGALDRTFDVIECSGVLHHMADPFAGARVLAGLLRPGGQMRIGVYSTIARAYLTPAKALAAGHPPTTEGIRAVRRAILDAAAGSPLREVAASRDFYSISACRDLLMHVQEQTLTFADLQRMLDENGLELEAVNVPPPILDIYRTMFPDAPLTDLDRWAQFEERHPATFRGMYQVSARKRA